MTKKIEVTSIDTQTFIKELYALFELGAKYNGGLAVKRPVLAVHLEIDEATVIPANPCVRNIPQERVQAKLSVKAPSTKPVAKKAAKRGNKQAKKVSQTPKQEAVEKEVVEQDSKG